MPAIRSKTSEASGGAASALVRVLERFPGARALAGELEAAFASATGLSVRQARRLVRLAALSGHVARSPKSVAGTYYGVPGTQSADVPEPDPVASYTRQLAGVSPEHRRDVALALLALGAAGGDAMKFDLVGAVAARAGRSSLWAVASINAAVAAAGSTAIAQRRTGQGERDVAYALVGGGLPGSDLDAWARAADFGLPSEHAALERHVRRAIGDAVVLLTPGQAEALRAVAAHGGTATAEELFAYGYEHRRAALAVVGTFRDPAIRPAWIVSEGGRRFRLASGMWPACDGIPWPTC